MQQLFEHPITRCSAQYAQKKREERVRLSSWQLLVTTLVLVANERERRLERSNPIKEELIRNAAMLERP